MFPKLSEYDPAGEGEGSLDPLRLEPPSDHLAEQLMPRVTARMHRVRALTFMAVSARVCAPYVDDYTADQTTPAYLAFEWMYAEAMAREGADSWAIPGVRMAANRLDGGGRLAARGYLKSPRALGLHGFYRRLSAGTRITDDGGWLDENGEALLAVWERERDLKGFFEGGGQGARVLRALRRDLQQTLASSRSCLALRGEAGLGLRRHLTPGFPSRSRRERVELRRILDGDEQRRATLATVDAGRREREFEDEAAIAAYVARRGPAAIRDGARALIAFERFSAALMEALRLVQWRSGQERMRPRPPEELATDRHRDLAKELPSLIESVDRAAEKVDADPSRDDAVAPFRGVRSGPGLIRTLLDRHDAVQAAKGTTGKRSWFERSDSGVWVRGDYAIAQEPAPIEGFVHPARLANAVEFLDELSPT